MNDFSKAYSQEQEAVVGYVKSHNLDHVVTLAVNEVVRRRPTEPRTALIRGLSESCDGKLLEEHRIFVCPLPPDPPREDEAVLERIAKSLVEPAAGDSTSAEKASPSAGGAAPPPSAEKAELKKANLKSQGAELKAKKEEVAELRKVLTELVSDPGGYLLLARLRGYLKTTSVIPESGGAKADSEARAGSKQGGIDVAALISASENLFLEDMIT